MRRQCAKIVRFYYALARQSVRIKATARSHLTCADLLWSALSSKGKLSIAYVVCGSRFLFPLACSFCCIDYLQYFWGLAKSYSFQGASFRLNQNTPVNCSLAALQLLVELFWDLLSFFCVKLKILYTSVLLAKNLFQ